MRVTERQLHTLSLRAVTNSRNGLTEAQNTAMTGVRVETPSDDPAAAARAQVLRSLQSEQAGYERNISFGRLRLESAEQSLAEAGSLLTRVKELAIGMANETLDASQRQLGANEIGALRANMIELANTKQGDEFVFAHVNTRQAPVDPAGNFTYDVNLYDQVRDAEIGANARGEIGSSGSHAFAQRAADPSSVDVFAMLDTLQAAMNANDPDAIRAQIDDIEQAHAQVVAERARVGTRMSRLDSAREAASGANQLYRRLEAELIDADAAEAFSELNLAETSFQAAITVAGRVFGQTLLDQL